MREIKIAPSIMCMDFNHLEDEIHKLERGGAHLFHFDIMDGVFVPNFTLGPDVIKALRKKTKISFDVHLMIAILNDTSKLLSKQAVILSVSMQSLRFI